MTSTMTNSTERNIPILNSHDGRMTDKRRWPSVPPDPLQTTLRMSLADKLLVNEDSHDVATIPRFLGCLPSMV